MVADSADASLVLRVSRVAASDRLRWRLAGADGSLLAEHESAEIDDQRLNAAVDLHRRWRAVAAPDDPATTAARLAGEVGTWLATDLLGPVSEALVAAAPADIRVDLGPGAEAVAALPLDLCLVDGSGLADRGVRFWCHLDGPGVERRGTGPVRMLAVLSQPTEVAALNPYRERRMLLRLESRLAETGLRLDLRILQYGTTRERLAEVIAEEAGWDVLHLAGHGRPGHLVLETEDGAPDEVSGGDLIQLLTPLRGRVRLMTLAACESGAMTVDRLRALLDEENPRDRPVGPPVEEEGVGTGSGMVALDLASELRTLLVAMRYPVGDEAATAGAEGFYLRALGATEPVTTAAQELAGAGGLPGGVVVVGAGRPDLILSFAGRRHLSPTVQRAALALPAGTPERFVGRAAEIAAIGRALAPASDSSGVLLVGMPGIGKTDLARITVAVRSDRFDRVVWHALEKTPSLVRFAEKLDDALDSTLVRHLADESRWVDTLAGLSKAWRSRSTLLVLDNTERLLDTAGRWLDPRWAQLLTALTRAGGPGRMLLPTRRPPTDPLPGLIHLPVGLLSEDEALLYARELPGLRRLLDGTMPSLPMTEGRALVRDLLAAAGGLPERLHLAEGQTHRPGAVAELAALPTDGTPAGGLSAWAEQVIAGLPVPASVLFGVLCHLPEADRTATSARLLMQGSTTNRVQRFVRRLMTGGADADRILAELVGYGLIDPEGDGERYRIHPVIAEVAASSVPEWTLQRTDRDLAHYWCKQMGTVSTEGPEERVSRYRAAGLRALPYLSRIADWGRFLRVAEHVLMIDTTYRTSALIDEMVGKVKDRIDGAHQPFAEMVLGAANERLAPNYAMTCFQEGHRLAYERGEWRLALVIGVRLIELTRRYGAWTDERIRLADSLPQICEQAGLGPWSQTAERLRRAQTWLERGVPGAEEKIEAVAASLPNLPDFHGHGESTTEWSVRENVAQLRRDLARRREDWTAMLEHNREQIGSQLQRGIAPEMLAMSWFNDYQPLRRLGRYAEATDTVEACLKTFDEAGENTMIATCHGALLQLAVDTGNLAAAREHGAAALRYGYRAGEVDALAATHAQLGDLPDVSPDTATGPDPLAVAHLLAAGLITRVARRPTADAFTDLLAGRGVPRDLLPSSVDELADRLDLVPGVDLRRLLTDLDTEAETEETLRHLTSLMADIAEPDQAPHH